MIRISIIVPVRNEAKAIERVLCSLLQQDYPADAFEILVVDGLSEDATVAIVERMQEQHPQIRLFSNPKRLSSAARNIGIRNAYGEFIIIVDGHCTIERTDYLRCLETAFVSSGADTLGRPQPLRVEQATLFQRCLARARQSKLGHNPDSAIFSDQAQFVRPQNVAVAYRREVFRRVGLFDERFDACEDVEFNYRVDQAGMTCYFTPTLSVSYHPRSTLRGLIYQMIRYGRGRARLAWKHPHSLTLPALVPALWLAWLVGGFMVGLFVPMFAALYCAMLLLYLTVIGMSSVVLGRTLPIHGAMMLPIVFIGIHLGFGWGMLREMIATWSPMTFIRRWWAGYRSPGLLVERSAQ